MIEHKMLTKLPMTDEQRQWYAKNDMRIASPETCQRQRELFLKLYLYTETTKAEHEANDKKIESR